MAWMNQHETNCEVAGGGQSKFCSACCQSAKRILNLLPRAPRRYAEGAIETGGCGKWKESVYSSSQSTK